MGGNIHVDGEKDIRNGDIATIRLTLTRAQLPEGAAVGAAHAPHFPSDVPEVWWFFVKNEVAGKLLVADRSKSPEREISVKMIFRICSKGVYRFRAFAVCDAYCGLDVSIPLCFTATEREEPVIKLHPDDCRLERVPTFFQQMMGTEPESDPDDDDEAPQKSDPAKKDDADSSTDSDLRPH